MVLYIFKAQHQHFFLDAITTFLPRSQHNKTLLSEVDHYLVTGLSDDGIFWR